MASIRKKGNHWQAQMRRIGHRSLTKSFIHLSEASTVTLQIEVKFIEGLMISANAIRIFAWFEYVIIGRCDALS